MTHPLCLLLVLVALCSGCTSDAGPRSDLNASWQTRLISSFDGGAGAAFEGDSLFFFRVFDAVLLEDGGAVLGITGPENHLIYLDSLGRAESVVGKTGAGPGEFQSILGLYPIGGDAVAAFDLRSQRLTTASRNGIEQTFSTADLPLGQRPLGFLGPDVAVSSAGSSGGVEPGTIRSYRLWHLTNAVVEDAGAFDALVEPRSNRVTLVNDNGPNYGISPGGSCLPKIYHAATPQGLWVAESESGRAALFDRTGGRRAEITDSGRATLQSESLSAWDDVVAQYESEYGAFTRASKQSARARIGVPGEPLQSAWSEIEVDPTGPVWLERAVCFETPTHRVWDIFAADGAKLGSVALRDGVRMLAVRGDRILAAETDALGVELLQLLEIER